MEFSLLDIVLFTDGLIILIGLVSFFLLVGTYTKTMRTKVLREIRNQRCELITDIVTLENGTVNVERSDESKIYVSRHGMMSVKGEGDEVATRAGVRTKRRLSQALAELKQLENMIEDAPACEVFGVDITNRNIGRFAAAMSTGLLYTVARTR